MTKGVTILGATGSVGTTTLEVIAQYPDRFHIVALTARQNLDQLLAQCRIWQPQYAVVADTSLFPMLVERLATLSPTTKALAGLEALTEVAALPQNDIVVAAIVGAAGLMPTLTAVRAKKRILLANKEVLVMAGALFMQEVHRHGTELLPIDSEHNAIFQCLTIHEKHHAIAVNNHQVSRITLTASGGAGRDLSIQQLEHLTPTQACCHPNWRMGKKISVDSATLMNKGFELMEACWLFDMPAEKVEVLIHPQSIVHSLVEYQDGSMLAHLANPDMRLPIAYGLAWPHRLPSGVKRLSLLQCRHLEFKPVDAQRYPCLQLAYQAIRAGGTAPASLNAANEIAVQAFLSGVICFTDIARLNQGVLENVPIHPASNLQAIWAADNFARETARRFLKKFQKLSAVKQIRIPISTQSYHHGRYHAHV